MGAPAGCARFLAGMAAGQRAGPGRPYNFYLTV
jgi:hypothetical protein